MGRLRVLLLLCVAAWPAGLASADKGPATPSVRHRVRGWGISVVMFKHWPVVPLEAAGRATSPDPLEKHLVARFFERGEQDRYTRFSTAGVAEVFAAGTPPGAESPERLRTSKVDMRALLVAAARRHGLDGVSLEPARGKVVKTKDGVRGTMWIKESEDSDWGGPYALFGVWEQDGMQVGMWIGGEDTSRREYALGFRRVIGSLLWTDDEATAPTPALPALDGVNLTEDRRREIERGLVRGWGVVVSPAKHYVVVFNTKGGRNAKLARLIAERIEAIRSQLYEVHFPARRPLDDVSIVRVCADAHEYHYYGGPQGSAGYWSPDTEELVFYDASPKRAVDEETLAVLYHEAFHQYIYYCAGRIAPHPWFNEGHGDYYAGARLRDGKFQVVPFRWRVRVVQDAIERGPASPDVPRGFIALDRLVSATQREYYTRAHAMYAAGWSLVYFLREIVPQNPDWNAKWGGIIDTYFRTLREEFERPAPAGAPPGAPPPNAPDGAPPPNGPPAPADGSEAPPAAPDASGIAVVLREIEMSRHALERAREVAFAGIDLSELERAWAVEVAKLKFPR